MKVVALNEPTAFALVSGLWKGEREPLRLACVLRNTNFRGDGLLDFSEVAELLVENRHSDARQLRPGDIIIERSGGGPKQPVGRVAYFDPPDDRTYFTSNFTTALRVVNRGRFDPRFVELYLHALYLSGSTEQLQRATTGIRNLDWQEYLRFEIPELPLAEQTLIADAIGGVRATCRKEEELLTALSDMKRAAMQELFTRGRRGEPQKETEIGPVPESWVFHTLGDIADIAYGAQAAVANAIDPSIGTLILTNVNLDLEGHIDLEKRRYYKVPEVHRERLMLRKGDVLFNWRSGSANHIGKTVFFDLDGKFTYSSFILRFRSHKWVLNKFLFWWLTHLRVSGFFTSQRNVSSINSVYNASLSATIPVWAPDDRQQREIVAILDAIDRKIDLHRKKRAALDELFKALLHKLMIGEVRVGDLDPSARAQARVAAQ